MHSMHHDYAHSHDHHTDVEINSEGPGFYNVTKIRDYLSCSERPIQRVAILHGIRMDDFALAEVLFKIVNFHSFKGMKIFI